MGITVNSQQLAKSRYASIFMKSTLLESIGFHEKDGRLFIGKIDPQYKIDTITKDIPRGTHIFESDAEAEELINYLQELAQGKQDYPFIQPSISFDDKQKLREDKSEESLLYEKLMKVRGISEEQAKVEALALATAHTQWANGKINPFALHAYFVEALGSMEQFIVLNGESFKVLNLTAAYPDTSNSTRDYHSLHICGGYILDKDGNHRVVGYEAEFSLFIQTNNNGNRFLTRDVAITYQQTYVKGVGIRLDSIEFKGKNLVDELLVRNIVVDADLKAIEILSYEDFAVRKAECKKYLIAKYGNYPKLIDAIVDQNDETALQQLQHEASEMHLTLDIMTFVFGVLAIATGAVLGALAVVTVIPAIVIGFVGLLSAAISLFNLAKDFLSRYQYQKKLPEATAQPMAEVADMSNEVAAGARVAPNPWHERLKLRSEQHIREESSQRVADRSLSYEEKDDGLLRGASTTSGGELTDESLSLASSSLTSNGSNPYLTMMRLSGGSVAPRASEVMDQPQLSDAYGGDLEAEEQPRPTSLSSSSGGSLADDDSSSEDEQQQDSESYTPPPGLRSSS